MEIKWGHFSDLHFQFKKCNFNTKLLRSSLIKLLEEEKPEFEYIFITGDIYNQGEYDKETTDFIKKIAELTKCKNENIILCPGNHDVERDDLRKKCIDSLIEKTQRTGNLVFDGKSYDILVTMYFKEFYKTCKEITGIEHNEKMHFILKNDFMNLIILNTSVFAGQTYPGQKFLNENEAKKEKEKNNNNLYICENNLHKLKAELDSNNQALNIVLAHHGIECFTESQQADFKNFLDELNVDLYLCGHVHKDSLIRISETENEIWQVSCGGLFVNKDNTPSFIKGTFNTENKEILLENYEYIPRNNCWDLSNSVPKPYKKGQWAHSPKRFQANKSNITNKLNKHSNQENDGLYSNFTVNIHEITLHTNLRQMNLNKPFENNKERIKSLFLDVEDKHLKLCDKIYNDLSSINTELKDIIYCFDYDISTYESDSCMKWNDFLRKIVFNDNIIIKDYKFSSIITNIIENYDTILFKIIQFSAKENLSNDIEERLHMVKTEIFSSNSAFLDYNNNLETIKKHISKSGCYIYLYGEQFFGKTTLIGKIIYDMCESTPNKEERLSSPIPWLPICIPVFGKQASNRETAIKMLVEQANIILPNPIDITSIKADKYCLESLFNILSNSMEKVLIIIDALDEIDADDLDIFPKKLPENCTVLLSTKNKNKEAKNKLDKLIYVNLEGFDENAVYKITGLTKRKNGAQKFIKQILYKTKGNPGLLTIISDDIKKNGGEIPKNYNESLTSLNSLFKQFKEKWKNGQSSNCELYKILELLTIFEKVEYLKIDAIQSYLIYKGYNVRSEQIKDLLKKVYTQIDSYDENRYKLKYNGFAEYLRDEYTDIDFQIIFNDVFEWLLQYKNKYDYLDKFFIGWYPYNNDFSRSKTKEIIDLLINDHKDLELKRILYFMNFILDINNNIKKELHELIIKCFEALIGNDDDEIMQLYFNYLYNVLGDDTSKQKSIKYLEQLADKKNEQAVLLYSKILSVGDMYIKKDINKALNYLKSIEESEESLIRIYTIYNNNSYLIDQDKSIAISYLNKLLTYDSEETKCIYASYIISGEIPSKTKEDGKRILEELAERGSEIAIERITHYILNNYFEEYTKEDAFKFLNKISKESQYGLFIKAKYIYLYENKAKGEKLIKKYADGGFIDAIIFMSEIEMNNKKLSQTRIEQLEVLAKRGDLEAAYILGSIFISENGRGKYNISEGIKWLEWASGNNYVDASNLLGGYYFDKDDFENSFAYYEKIYVMGKHDLAVINMAYLMRKGLVKSKEQYDFKEMLLEIINENANAFAVINYVLYCISKTDDLTIWNSAINLILRIDENSNHFKDSVKWWTDLSSQGDGEGDLVLGLLMYTNKLTNNVNGKNIIQRFKAASDSGYTIPKGIMGF